MKPQNAFRVAFVTILALFLIVVVTAVVTAYSGRVQVAATKPPPGFVQWFLRTTRDRSVAVASRGLLVPKLGDDEVLGEGLEHYREMCVGCHGAPGVDPDATGQGLEPRPPRLYRGSSMTDREKAETFWIIKHGIQMTGMPAFGKTHDDQKIWAITGFVGRLRGMSADEYARLAGGAPPHDED